MSAFQIISYYLHGLSVSAFILFVSEIHKLSFQPPFASSDTFPRIQMRYSVMFTYQPPQGSPTMSAENIMDSGSYFVTQSISTSTSMWNRYGLKADGWCNPTSKLSLLISPPATRAPWFGNLCTMPVSV